jgi:predicted ATPase
VLWLDDLHWADDGTLDFVEQLARARRAGALLILALARRHSASAGPAGSRIEARASRPIAFELPALGDAPSHRLA